MSGLREYIPATDPFWIDQSRKIAATLRGYAAYNRANFPAWMVEDLAEGQEQIAAKLERKAALLEAGRYAAEGGG